jgi:hypothetical protein
MREQRKEGKFHHDTSRYRTVRVGEKFKKEYRLVMESAIKRSLNASEWVHHIDGDPGNNKIENLFLVSPVEHHRLHKLGLRDIWEPN